MEIAMIGASLNHLLVHASRCGALVSLLIGFWGSAAVLTGCQIIRTSSERGGEEIQTRSVLPVPAARRLSENAGGALLAYDIQSRASPRRTVSDGECRLRVENLETKKTAFFDLKSDQTASYVELEPGRYNLRRLGCGFARIWDLEGFYHGGFVVRPGTVSYLGKLVFDFEDFDKGELGVIRKVSRLESAEAFERARGSVNGSPAFISAFTGAPLVTGQGEGTERESFDVFVQGYEAGRLSPERVLAPLMSRLQECANQTAKTDPLQFGQLEITAVYRGGVFQSFKDERNRSALAAELITCVETALRKFRPKASGAPRGDLEVRVRY